MRKKFVYFVVSLTLIISINSCLKYKELSDVNGLGLEVQGATPLFSYTLTMQDLFFKIIRSDSSNLSLNLGNRVYQWTENIATVNAKNAPNDSLYKNVPTGNFIGMDSVSYNTTSDFLGKDILIVLVTPFTQPPYTFTYPIKQGKMKKDGTSINIIKLNNISGKLKLKIKNTFIFPVKIKISFPELPTQPDVNIDTLGRLSEEVREIPITNLNWIGKETNVINYNITVTLINVDNKASFFGDTASTNNLGRGIVKVEDTFVVDSYDAIFGDVGGNRYLFTDSIRQKINITDPFILDPQNNSLFPQISLQMDYSNHTLGIDAKAVLFDFKFKMKNGTEIPVSFFNKATNSFSLDSFLFPLGIDRMTQFNGPSKPAPSITLDTTNTNFQELNLNLREIDTLLYKVKFYSLKNSSEDTNSFIRQPSDPNFVNSVSGKFIIPYVLSSKIFIDTSKTSVINIPEKFYTDVDNIIKNKNGTGELQEIELSMTVENYTIFSIVPQVYFMNNNQIIDSFSIRQRIPAATLSSNGLVSLPNTMTITKKLTPTQWEQMKQCNRLTSSMFLETPPESGYSSITSKMYVKFYFKVGNIGFKYLIKK